VFVPIATGMTTDAPSHVYAHKKQLFFSFIGSVQHAAPGTPYIWSPVLGASELAMGDTVTGFMSQPGSESVGALAIFTRNQTSILYGTGVANWQLISYRSELGAYAYSIQDVGYTLFLDDQGITNLQTAQAFGNFSHAALSKRIRPWLNTQRTKTTASCVSRDKSQYRLFFSDQYALYLTFDGRKVIGMMPMLLGNAVRCVWSSEESDGSETIFFGSTNGMVYQMEKGTSFDGDAIEHYLHLAFNFSKSPRVNKRYREVRARGVRFRIRRFQLHLRAGVREPGDPAAWEPDDNDPVLRRHVGFRQLGVGLLGWSDADASSDGHGRHRCQRLDHAARVVRLPTIDSVLWRPGSLHIKTVAALI
jgi:hypothetical protein